MRRALSLPAVALAALAACSTSTTPSASGGTPLAAAVSAPPSPSSTAAATPDDARIGATQTSVDPTTRIRVTLLHVRQLRPVVAGIPERKGNAYYGIEVKACLAKTSDPRPISLGWGPWSLTTTNDVVVEEMSSWSDEWFDVPLYPVDHVVKVGRCARGWIPFEARRGSRMEYVTYQPEGANLVEWQAR